MILKDRKILITGANRGLGKTLVEELLKHKVSTIYAGARRPSAIIHQDPRVIPVAIDVTDENSVKTLASKLHKLDLLINNAGILTFGDILETSEQDIDTCIEVNLKGIWRLSRALAPALISSKGSLCNILSLLSLVSAPGLAAYNLSKAAAWSVTQSLRATLYPHGVSVFGVYPGVIDTDMAASMDSNKASPEDIARDIIHKLMEGKEDIYPGVAENIYHAWRKDHKAVEKQFASG